MGGGQRLTAAAPAEYAAGVLALFGEADRDGDGKVRFDGEFTILWEHLGGRPDGTAPFIDGQAGACRFRPPSCYGGCGRLL